MNKVNQPMEHLLTRIFWINLGGNKSAGGRHFYAVVVVSSNKSSTSSCIFKGTEMLRSHFIKYISMLTATLQHYKTKHCLT